MAKKAGLRMVEMKVVKFTCPKGHQIAIPNKTDYHRWLGIEGAFEVKFCLVCGHQYSVSERNNGGRVKIPALVKNGRPA